VQQGQGGALSKPPVFNCGFQTAHFPQTAVCEPALLEARDQLTLKSRAKLRRQVTAIDFAALVHRNFFDEENPLRDLPAAEMPAAKFQQIGFANAIFCHDAGGHLFIAQN
jgi:hypothetical protein